MTVGELVFASVVDQRVYDVQSERASNGVYLLGVPGRALPFVLYRAWKIGTGTVTESVDFYGPSGRLVYRWGPVVRRMLGMMDLTEERDLVEDAQFDETGMFIVSFAVEDEIVGEIECPVFVQPAPAKLPKDIEDGLRGSDVIWVGLDQNGKSDAAATPRCESSTLRSGRWRAPSGRRPRSSWWTGAGADRGHRPSGSSGGADRVPSPSLRRSSRYEGGAGGGEAAAGPPTIFYGPAARSAACDSNACA